MINQKFKNIFIQLFTLLLMISMISFLSMTYYINEKYSINNLKSRRLLRLKSSEKFLLKPEKTRLNKLFELLIKNEKHYSNILNKLSIIVFSDLINNANNSSLNQFKDYFDVNLKKKTIQVNEKFIKHLQNKSDFYSFKLPKMTQHDSKHTIGSQEKPVILTAANHKYYEPLKQIILNVKIFYPTYLIYIYNLGGLSQSMINELKILCNKNCIIIKFDADHMYKSKSAHVSNLITYSWKPLIIQEILSKHNSVIYIDTSIRFNTDKIGKLIESCTDRGLLTRYLDLYLTCFTHVDMFKWFDEDKNLYENVHTLEANFMIFDRRNVITQLVMKAWVHCALDENCISPKGSHIYGGMKNWLLGCNKNSCGCHRFDQDALTIISTYFYGFPMGFYYKPAIALTDNEMNIIDVNRRNILTYIFDQIKLYL